MDLVVCFLVGLFYCIDNVEKLLRLVPVMKIELEVVRIGFLLPVFGASIGVFSCTNTLEYLILPGLSC